MLHRIFDTKYSNCHEVFKISFIWDYVKCRNAQLEFQNILGGNQINILYYFRYQTDTAVTFLRI